MIILFAAIGTYSLAFNAFDVYAIVFFGILGYILIKCGCEPAPFLLGFVLGPLLEENLRRALIISRGDPTVFVTRPLSAVLLVLAVAALVVAVLPTIRKRRDEVFTDDETGSGLPPPTEVGQPAPPSTAPPSTPQSAEVDRHEVVRGDADK
jgi:TctA family transporter